MPLNHENAFAPEQRRLQTVVRVEFVVDNDRLLNPAVCATSACPSPGPSLPTNSCAPSPSRSTRHPPSPKSPARASRRCNPGTVHACSPVTPSEYPAIAERAPPRIFCGEGTRRKRSAVCAESAAANQHQKAYAKARIRCYSKPLMQELRELLQGGPGDPGLDLAGSADRNNRIPGTRPGIVPRATGFLCPGTGRTCSTRRPTAKSSSTPRTSTCSKSLASRAISRSTIILPIAA